MHRDEHAQEIAQGGEIDLRIAGMLTGRSIKTMQRWCVEGVWPSRVVDQRGKRLVSLQAVLPYTPIETGDSHLVLAAAMGQGDALNEIGVIYLMADKPKLAYEWFALAGKAGHADAMHWLSKFFIYGDMGKKKDETLGMSWLAAAAAKGHVIAREQWARLGIGGS